jgi:lysophospholipase L1-like esterase
VSTGNARHIRRIVKAAMVGGGGVLGIGAATAGVLAAQTEHARRTIGPRQSSAPYADGRYGRAKGTSLRLVMIGDSVAAGLGADRPRDTIGAVLAALVAEHGGREVVLNSVATVGARSRDLPDQVSRALPIRPHVAVVIIGGNDVTHAVRPQVSVRLLSEAVQRLRAAGVQVVVGTCPDLGTVRPIRPPLRWVARRLSRTLAAAQAVAVVQAGGRAVSLGDLLGPEFSLRPDHLFSSDQFHPSSAGYTAVAQVLASSVLAALVRGESGEVLPDRIAPPTVAPLAQAAATSAARPGTELSATSAPRSAVGPSGRWGRVLRRGGPQRGSGTADPAADSPPAGGRLEPFPVERHLEGR